MDIYIIREKANRIAVGYGDIWMGSR